jgi:hypothetical protein
MAAAAVVGGGLVGVLMGAPDGMGEGEVVATAGATGAGLTAAATGVSATSG